jgi:hypothetical protein
MRWRGSLACCTPTHPPPLSPLLSILMIPSPRVCVCVRCGLGVRSGEIMVIEIALATRVEYVRTHLCPLSRKPSSVQHDSTAVPSGSLRAHPLNYTTRSICLVHHTPPPLSPARILSCDPCSHPAATPQPDRGVHHAVQHADTKMLQCLRQ